MNCPRGLAVVCCLFLLTSGATSRSAENRVLDIVPTRALASFAVHDIASLEKKGDALLKETGISLTRRPLEIFNQGLTSEGISKGLDRSGSFAIFLVDTTEDGKKFDKDQDTLIDSIVVAVPVGDRATLARSLGIAARDQKSNEIVAGTSSLLRGQYVCRDGHYFMSQAKRPLELLLQSPSIRDRLSEAGASTFQKSDVLFHCDLRGMSNKLPEGGFLLGYIYSAFIDPSPPGQGGDGYE